MRVACHYGELRELLCGGHKRVRDMLPQGPRICRRIVVVCWIKELGRRVFTVFFCLGGCRDGPLADSANLSITRQTRVEL